MTGAGARSYAMRRRFLRRQSLARAAAAVHHLLAAAGMAFIMALIFGLLP